MKGCNACPAFGKCTAMFYRSSACSALRGTYGVTTDPELEVPPTNADRIRSMSDEELAKWMLNWVECDNDGYMCNAKRYKNSKRCDGHCVENHLDWLRQPAEAGDHR